MYHGDYLFKFANRTPNRSPVQTKQVTNISKMFLQAMKTVCTKSISRHWVPKFLDPKNIHPGLTDRPIKVSFLHFVNMPSFHYSSVFLFQRGSPCLYFRFFLNLSRNQIKVFYADIKCPLYNIFITFKIWYFLEYLFKP